MSSIFGALFSWPVLVGAVVVVGLVLLLSRVLVNKPKAVQTILSVLEHAHDLIVFFMPEKFREVYQALIAAAKRVSDGVFTKDEALQTARDVFNQTLKQLSVTLSDEEKKFIDTIIIFVVDMIVKDKAASVAVVTEICNVKGWKF